MTIDEMVLGRGAGEVGMGSGGSRQGPGGGRGWRRLRGVADAVVGHPVMVVLIVIVGVLVVVGVAGGLSGSPPKGLPGVPGVGRVPTAGAGATGSGAAAAAPGATGGASAGPAAAQGVSSGSSGSSGSPGSGGAASAVPALPDRVIKTGSLNLLVPAGRLLVATTSMSDESAGLGGFVATSSTNTATPGSPPSGDITLRVPAASFGVMLSDVEKLGRPTSITTSGQDVTGQYVDLQARIQALGAARSQFQQIVTRAQSIGDILAVEQQIGGLQTQIDQLQGQLKVLDDQSSYGTLSVHVVEAVPAGTTHPAQPAGGLSKAWLHARHSFARGFDSIVAFSGGLLLFLVVIGVLAGLARLVWIVVRRRPV